MRARIPGSTAWFGNCGNKAGLPDFGERLGYGGKAVNSYRADQPQDRQDPRRRLGKARDDRRRREDRQSLEKGEVVVRLRVARRHQVRDPGGLQRHPSVESRDQRAERGQAVRGNAALQGLQRGPGLDSGPAKLWDRYGIRPLHTPRGRKRTTRPRQTRPLFDDNVYQRGEVLVLKPASNGTGFEADRGACGTLKYRCPAAAFGCAGRKECYRARRAGEPSASTSMTVGFSRRPLGQLLLEAGLQPPFRPGSIAGSTTLTEKHYVRGMRAPAARPRDGGGNGAWQPAGGTSGRSLVGPVGLRDRPLRASDRPLQLAACGHGPARPGFAA